MTQDLERRYLLRCCPEVDVVVRLPRDLFLVERKAFVMPLARQVVYVIAPNYSHVAAARMGGLIKMKLEL